MQYVNMTLDDKLCFLITLIHDPAHFLIDHRGDLLTVISRMPEISAEKYFFLTVYLVVNQPNLLRHTILDNHRLCGLGCLLDVCRSTGCDIAEDQFLCDSSTKADHDILQHMLLRHKHIIILRQWHRISASTTSIWNNGYKMHRSNLAQ